MVLVVSRVHDRPSHMAVITWFVLLLCIIKGYLTCRYGLQMILYLRR